MLNSRWSCLLALVCTVAASPATAEQWTAKAKIANGRCNDGASVAINETPGSMHLTFSLNGKSYAEVDLKLASDGSGKTIFPGSYGQTSLEVPAGSGKRQFKTTHIGGICQWLWN